MALFHCQRQREDLVVPSLENPDGGGVDLSYYFSRKCFLDELSNPPWERETGTQGLLGARVFFRKGASIRRGGSKRCCLTGRRHT